MYSFRLAVCAGEGLWHWVLICPALGAFADRNETVFKLPTTAGEFAALLDVAGYSGKVQWVLRLQVRKDACATSGSMVLWHKTRQAWYMNNGHG